MILVGGDPMTSKRLGFKRSDSVAEALEMAQDTVGPSPSDLHAHPAALYLRGELTVGDSE